MLVDLSVIDDTELVRKYVKGNIDNIKVYSAIAYNDKVDRDNEQVDLDNLQVMADKIVGKPLCIDHCSYSADGVIGRVIDSHVSNTDGCNSLVVKFYTPYEEVQEKIDNGIYYNVSLGFGADTLEVDGVTKLKVHDVYELSIVCVPAVKDAHIKSFKHTGGMRMTFRQFKIKQFKLNNPDIADQVKELEDIENGENVLTDSDVEGLFNENETLKARCKELEDAIAKLELDKFKSDADDAIADELSKAVEDMLPDNDVVKQVIIDEIKSLNLKAEVVGSEDTGAFITKSGKYLRICGLDEAVQSVKAKYSKLGLVGKQKAYRGVDFSVNNNSNENKVTKSFNRGVTFTIN